MNDHYYTENPLSEITEKEITLTINNNRLDFKSVSGVFGFSAYIDKASALLIKSFEPSGHRILDVGCGFGTIGLSLKKLFPDTELFMSDINTRAVEYTKINAKANHITAKCAAGNLFDCFPNEKFNDIVSNPPFAAGKAVCYSLIKNSISYLSENGSLWLTCYHNKGGKTLRTYMYNVFGNVTDVEKSGGIHVYKSIFRL